MVRFSHAYVGDSANIPGPTFCMRGFSATSVTKPGQATRLLTVMATVYAHYGPLPHGEGQFLIGQT